MTLSSLIKHPVPHFVNPYHQSYNEVVTIATRSSAAVVGLAGQIGQLAPGYLADIILVDTSGALYQHLHSLTASLVYNTRAGDSPADVVRRIIFRNHSTKIIRANIV